MKEKITIDLELGWQDNAVEWGIFKLSVWDAPDDVWGWQLAFGIEERFGEKPTKELAIEACKKALKRIITGVKE